VINKQTTLPSYSAATGTPKIAYIYMFWDTSRERHFWTGSGYA